MPHNTELPRIAFNSIFDSTELYVQLARHLEGKAECFFITPDIYTNRRLFSYGIPADRILDISITKKEMRGLPPPSEDMLGKAAE